MDHFQKDNVGQKDNLLSSPQYIPALFHHDHDLYLIYKKVENITAALFLTTNLISDTELLKNRIRNHVLDCLNETISLIGSASVDVQKVQLIGAYLLHTSSLLDIAFWSGLMSQMNVSVLQREVNSTYQIVTSLSNKYKNKFFIDSSFFSVRDERISALKEKDIIQATDPKPIKKDDFYKGHTIGHNKGQEMRPVIKDSNKSAISSSITTETKNQRRSSIIKLLSEKSNLSVKDFIAVIPGVSEKTIQRELLALVDEGVLKRVGERRWSTYTLAQ